MNEELELLKTIATRLSNAGIEYMMTGSMAMAAYAMPRMTRDIDIVIHIESSEVATIVELLKQDFYVDEPSVRQAVRDRGMFNAIHNESVIKVDFIVRKDSEYRVEEFSRRRSLDVDGTAVSIVAPEDLLLSKLVWAKRSESDLQLRDVRWMLESVSDIDTAYLHNWADKLGVAHLLESARKND
jgi:hypothetical protein